MEPVKKYRPDDVDLTCMECEWFGTECETDREDLPGTEFEVMHCPRCAGTYFRASHLRS